MNSDKPEKKETQLEMASRIFGVPVTKAQPDDPIFQEGPQMFSVPPGWNEKHNKWKREKAAEERRKQVACMNEDLYSLIVQSASTDTLTIVTQAGCDARGERGLQVYRPDSEDVVRELMLSGYWSQDIHHSGWKSFMLAYIAEGVRIVECVSRNTILDSVTEEDVEEECLNDDQLQALWGSTLEEAQNATWREIAAVCIGAPKRTTAAKMAQLFYDALCSDGEPRIEEIDETGLIGPRKRRKKK